MHERFEMPQRPLTPAEIDNYRETEVIPPQMYEVFNELIAEKMRNGTSTFKLKTVVERVKERGLNTEDLFDKGAFDVEPLYAQAGWKVRYDQPGYDDNYDPYFIFSVPK